MNDFEGRLTGFRKIRTGGEAVVYRAMLDGNTPVVFKWYLEEKPIDPKSIDVFISEAFEGTSRLYGYGSLKGRPYFVAEYIRGTSSSAVSPMPPKKAVKALRKLCATLNGMLKANVLHGDISPDNIMIDASGNPGLIDFGIQGLGTPKFSAPERFEGAEPSVKSEIFSLGALLYFWIAGEPLFGGETFSSVEKSVFNVDSYDESLLLHGHGKLPAEDLRVFQTLWKGTLRRNPEDRFEDFDELDECLEIAENELSHNGISVDREKNALWKDELGLLIRERESQIDSAPEEFLFASEPVADLPEQNLGIKSTETKFPTGKILLGSAVFLFVALLLVFIFFFRTSSQDVENVGKSMLENSRSLHMDEGVGSLEQDTVVPVRGIMTDVDSVSTDAQ